MSNISMNCTPPESIIVEDTTDYDTTAAGHSLADFTAGVRAIIALDSNGTRFIKWSLGGTADTPDAGNNTSYTVDFEVGTAWGEWIVTVITFPFGKVGVPYNINSMILVDRSDLGTNVYGIYTALVDNAVITDLNNISLTDWELFTLFDLTTNLTNFTVQLFNYVYEQTYPQLQNYSSFLTYIPACAIPEFDVNTLSIVTCPSIIVSNDSVYFSDSPKYREADVAYINSYLNHYRDLHSQTQEFYSHEDTITFDLDGKPDGKYTIKTIILFAPQSGVDYFENDVVYSDGVIYSCISDTTYADGQLSNTVLWEVIELEDVPAYFYFEESKLVLCASTKCYLEKAQEFCGDCKPEDICKSEDAMKAAMLAILGTDIYLTPPDLEDDMVFLPKLTEYIAMAEKICNC